MESCGGVLVQFVSSGRATAGTPRPGGRTWGILSSLLGFDLFVGVGEGVRGAFLQGPLLLGWPWNSCDGG